MNKKLFTLLFVMSGALTTFAQVIQVGDTVMVKRTVQKYLTGEEPSKWVYDVPHTISQVGSKYYPEGVLLNIEGANSWLAETDVTLLSHHREASSAKSGKVETAPQTAAVSVASQEPIIIHDTIVRVERETIRYVQVDTVHVEKLPIKKTYCQMNGNLYGLIGKDHAGLGIDFVCGARMGEHIFLGGGVGLEQLWLNIGDDKSMHVMQFPFYADVRAYLPIQSKYFPYIELATGLNLFYGQLNLEEKEVVRCGLFTRAGIGFEYEKFSMGVGYQYSGKCSLNEDFQQHAYLKVGFLLTR